MSGGCNSTSDGLENQREDIATTEYESVRARLETRDVLAVDDNNARQAEIDACREERRGNREGDKVHKEIVARGIEDVVPKQNPANISNYFTNKSQSDSDCISPCFISHSKIDLCNQIDGKDSSVEDICTKIGAIFDGSESQIAC